MKNLSKRIRMVREGAGLTQDDMAKSIGMTVATINRYEKGHRSPDADFLDQMVKLFKCDAGWLLTGQGPMERGKGEKPLLIKEGEASYGDNFVFIPQVRGEISAGGGLMADDMVEIRIAFRRDWIEKRGDPKRMSLIRISGDSMEPTFLSGDLVLVDHSRDYFDPQGGIYALAIGDSIMIKRIQLIPSNKEIRIISDNPLYEAQKVNPDEIRINGKIIWYGRELER